MCNHSVVSDSLQSHELRSPPGSSVHGILQARILEWVAISSPGDLLDPGMEPRSPTLQADFLPSEPPGKPCNPHPLSQERKSTQGSLQGWLPPTPVYTLHCFSWLFNPVCLFQNWSIILAQVPLHSPQSHQDDRRPAMEPGLA